MIKNILSRTALLVVDMQNGFLGENGGMAKLGFDSKLLQKAIPGCVELVQIARQKNTPVIFTQYLYEKDFRDGGIQVEEIFPGIKEVGLCAIGSHDSLIIDELKPKTSEIIIEKNRPSSFYSTRLETYLRSQKINNLVICGVTTNICVETTARDSAQRDFGTYVVSDAVAEVDDFRHTISLKALEHMFAKIVTVKDVTETWLKKNS
ncbi:MAG: Peroxyureidoacrylate/ureidoacrylate amidohydrolase RutB [Alphaproteobacteria bacterium MarineAlpha2_Bin1]|nr:MAG: Peroxyureidoacrylate/ureidoacrylate amidohydrolase RutB [Alphaproteobacteria bacterium MarineAlpha2_Bin1]|tara:strand:- start:923 stop:1540 length:618 start_codon:yes stop_codon:yes gene_type:complete